MNYYDEFETQLDNGIEDEFQNYDEGSFADDFQEGDSFDEEFEDDFQDNEYQEARKYKRAPNRRVSNRNPLKRQINILKRRVDKLSRSSSPRVLARKIKAIEDSMSKMENSQLINALLGYPKIDEITFADSDLGKKEVENTSYEIPILQLLMNKSGTGNGMPFGKDNMLLFLLMADKSNSNMKDLLPLLLLSGGLQNK